MLDAWHALFTSASILTEWQMLAFARAPLTLLLVEHGPSHLGSLPNYVLKRDSC